jgi:hypothetical protein
MCSKLSFKLLVSKLFPQFSLRALKKVIHEEEYKTLFHGIHQTIQKNSVGFIPWDGITEGKDQIP